MALSWKVFTQVNMQAGGEAYDDDEEHAESKDPGLAPALEQI